MMEVTFEYDGPAEDRVFRDVLALETGEYEHVNGTGTEATISQRYEGEVETFPVRGYDELSVTLYTPDDEPEDAEAAAARAEIEAERKLDERRERHFDRHGHFGAGRPDPGPD